MADKEQHTSLVHTFYSLERPDWLMNSGMGKGIFHDRYALGAVLSAGVKIRFRQSFPASGMGSILQLLNNDSKTEIQQEVTTAWRELISNVSSVPFFTTPYTEHARERIGIEVEIEGDWKILPIYKAGGNAYLFFNAWDSLDAEYALFDSTYAKILIPAKDKAALKALHQVSGLESLTDYYAGIFEHFNYLAGLSFNSTVPTDKNIPNRYFMKADKSGAGAAYYGWGATAVTSDSVAEFWLDIKGTNWGSIHEIGHGYEGSFRDNSTINLSEVWNNLFAASYQSKVLGEEVYQLGWLYSGGEETTYRLVRAGFDNGTVGKDLGLTLYFLLLIFARAGDRSIIEFHKRYRRVSNEPGFRVVDLPTMDFLSRVTIDVANVDVSAFMEFTKASLTARQVMENAYSNANAFYPLYLLVPESDLTRVRELLGLRSTLDLVSCAQLAKTGLTGDVTFHFTGLYNGLGKHFLLRDGAGAVRVVKVTSPLVTVRGLPVGMYVVQLPYAEENGYLPVNYYVAVKDNTNVFRCVYEKRVASALADNVVYLRGLNGVFCRLDVKVSNGNLFIDVLSTAPHSYYAGQVYAEVTIKNAQDHIVFFRSILGDVTELFSSGVAIAKDFIVEILHKEPSRLDVANSFASLIDTTAQVNRLKVTDQGLVNISLVTDAGENLKAEIDKCAAIFEKSPHLVLHDEYPLKYDMRRAINTFTEPVRSELFERYRAVEFSRPKVNGLALGSKFTWHFQGNAGRTVGYVRINLPTGKIDISFSAVSPHEYFSSVYVSVMVKSKEGEVLYLRELRGDVVAEASHVQLPLVLGCTVSVMHREPSRSWIVNEDNQKIFPAGRVQHVMYNAISGINFASYWSTTNNESLIEE
ncbi:hypothetical protein JFU37_04010 [Pseudomonas sp. TH41]|uniref:putative mucin/carbohydrate-binding domain-containing protein n=1 Tax=Pseudomonas sp. TH41 TaxID=2796405 RepID=UPI0019123E5B|nr:putative mucin/carbohydrate-binding domain-containing protein [Pseudomonas sp. TH41]MBK5351682.1 hypothetical protein [Pseudomonas sp. TH41]